MELIPTREEEKDYKPACNYIPRNFTEKGDLKLLKGKLSPEFELVFNEDVLKEDYEASS